MTKFLIVSDTHGDRDILVDIFNHWQSNVAAVFYNGDSELSANDSVFDGVSTVIGNMDNDDDFVAARVTTIAGTTFFQTHGHLYNVRSLDSWANLTVMNQLAKEAKAQIVLFGHTHIDGVAMFDDKLFINPGSISLPKGPHMAIGGTYAVLTVSDTAYSVAFYNRQHEEIPALTQSFNR